MASSGHIRDLSRHRQSAPRLRHCQHSRGVARTVKELNRRVIWNVLEVQVIGRVEDVREMHKGRVSGLKRVHEELLHIWSHQLILHLKT
jgi:hypothetical protein